MNDTFIEDYLSNEDLNNIGFWIRPDLCIGGLSYSKLYLENLQLSDIWRWKTMSTDLCVHASSDIYSLQYDEKQRTWTADLSAYESPCINLMSSYMRGELQAVLEGHAGYGISWTKIHDISELTFENYEGKDIVWRVQKYWTHPTHMMTADSLDTTAWLDKFEELSDGTQHWYKTGIEYERAEDWKRWRPIETVTDMISRPPAAYPYQTSLWQISSRTAIGYPVRIAALHNTKHMCLQYNPVEVREDLVFDIFYVVADAFPRKTYEQMLLKEREWSVYNDYLLSGHNVLYDDSWPYFY